jgi:deoxycytidylate deaminase
MALPAKNIVQKELLQSDEEKDLVKKLKSNFSQEVVFGLCGPIGAPIREVGLRLQALLNRSYAYQPDVLKLSDYILKYPTKTTTPDDAAGRYQDLINKGNSLRNDYGNSVLAELAIADIAVRRQLLRSDSGKSPSELPIRFCHIIDSIKNEAELKALKTVYGDLFICIGVYASVESRESRLRAKRVSDENIPKLINRDSGEEIAHGQSVRDIFHQADFFINCSSNDISDYDAGLQRIADLVFGSKIITPTSAETAMYTAFTASLNSACLSRQVGAAVTDKDGNLLGVGWNDVPKFDGGVYSEQTTDKRCYNIGGRECFNDQEKLTIAQELTNELVAEGIIPAAMREATLGKIRKGRIRDLIEFSRAVHAEMLALLNAGRTSGNRVQGGKIFVTTYPCHACARHIIAAGIHEIYYIEPYRKSLATRLHEDALTEKTVDPGKVKLLPFEGVSPNRYSDFFRIGSSPVTAGVKCRHARRG